MFWTQSEFATAQRDLFGLIDLSVRFQTYRDELEEQQRTMAGRGTKVTLVPARAAEITRDYADRAGGSVTDEAIRRDYLDDVAQRTGTVAWPLGRNTPCWCGSGAKLQAVLRNAGSLTLPDCFDRTLTENPRCA